MRRNISNVLCVIGAPLFESTLAPRRSIAFRNSAGTWSRAPGKQFGVLGRWRDRHTRPARWSDTLRIRPVRWRKWNRIRIDLARLADPIDSGHGGSCESYRYDANMRYLHIVIMMISLFRRSHMTLPWWLVSLIIYRVVIGSGCFRQGQAAIELGRYQCLFVYRLGFGVTRSIEW